MQSKWGLLKLDLSYIQYIKPCLVKQVKYHFALLVHRSLKFFNAVLLPPSVATVHFPLEQRAHSRHAQSERENGCSLFPLVILGLLSALSVLILWPALCWSAPFI